MEISRQLLGVVTLMLRLKTGCIIGLQVIAASYRNSSGLREQQVPPLRYPGFPVEVDGVGFMRLSEPHTRPGTVPRGRKSGYVRRVIILWKYGKRLRLQNFHPDLREA